MLWPGAEAEASITLEQNAGMFVAPASSQVKVQVTLRRCLTCEMYAFMCGCDRQGSPSFSHNLRPENLRKSFHLGCFRGQADSGQTHNSERLQC
jgi:hypothetical protein